MKFPPLRKAAFLFLSVCLLGTSFACDDNTPEQNEPETTDPTDLVEDSTPPSDTSSEDVYTIAFYNVENLFDTEDDAGKKDEEFMPDSDKKWTNERYQDKLSKIAEVISKIGDTDGAEVMGVCEIENARVLEDLIAQPSLKDQDYGFVHHESPDVRGIDVALLYKKSVFSPISSKNYVVELADNPNFKTRDILHVSGQMNGEEVHFLINHWSSRRGGEKESEHKRIKAAQVAKQIISEIKEKDANAKILLMGDFNDEPHNKSIKEELSAVAALSEVDDTNLFNALGELDNQGRGTYNYRGDWNMLDQIILNKSFIKGGNWKYLEADIYSPDYLLQQEGRYKGYPDRTYAGAKYLGGYSDHLPVFIHVSK